MVVPLLSLIQSFHEMSHACQALSCDSLTIWGRGEGLGLGVPYDSDRSSLTHGTIPVSQAVHMRRHVFCDSDCN